MAIPARMVGQTLQARNRLLEAYLTAREHIVEAGYGMEIDWQDRRDFRSVSESDFLREAAWVVLSAGMAEAVIRRVFGRVSVAFLKWKSAAAIAQRREQCAARARRAFGHERKLRAIGLIAQFIDDVGFDTFKARVSEGGPAVLRELEFIGPVTSFHLAKNIGLDVVKPDRHLVRAAKAARMNEPQDLCRVIAELTGDRLATVDLVIWRYATLRCDYEQLFAIGPVQHGVPAIWAAARPPTAGMARPTACDERDKRRRPPSGPRGRKE